MLLKYIVRTKLNQVKGFDFRTKTLFFWKNGSEEYLNHLSKQTSLRLVIKITN